MTTYDNIKETALRKIKKHGFLEEKPKKYELLRLKGQGTIVLYKTGKLLIQGSSEQKEEIKKLIEYLGIAQNKKTFSGIAVGRDETLKGDTFGGIVVAGFKADDTIRDELVKLGVKDSKQLTKPQIVELACTLMERYPKNFHVEALTPKEYNKQVAKQNVTKI